MVDYGSINFKFGYLMGVLEIMSEDNDRDIYDFVNEMNHRNRGIDLGDIDMLDSLCELFCGETIIVSHKDIQYVIIGDVVSDMDSLIGVVFWNPTLKKVVLLDKYDDDKNLVDEITEKAIEDCE